MPRDFYFGDERHTLASALRCALEEQCLTNELVSCTLLHPLDEFIKVRVPSNGGEELVRKSLLSLKSATQNARREIMEQTA